MALLPRSITIQAEQAGAWLHTQGAEGVRHRVNDILLCCESRGAPLQSELVWICMGSAET